MFRKNKRGHLGVASGLLLILVALLLSRCVAIWTPPISGLVVNDETGEPIQGVYIIARWFVVRTTIGPHPVKDQVCSRMAIGLTDSSGTFRFPPALTRPVVVFGWVNNTRSGVGLYKPGLVRKSYNVNDYHLIRPASKQRHLDAILLTGLQGFARCGSASPLPVLRAIYEEAVSVAGPSGVRVSTPGQKTVADICDRAASEAGIRRFPPSVWGGLWSYDPEPSLFDTRSSPMCPITHPAWTGADSEYREVFEQIEKDFFIQLEGMPQ